MPSVQTYIDLHAGPEFQIQWRYGAILFQTSVALFYGTGLPVLYLIAILGCSIQYVLDRLMVCYFYKEPPTYDDRITNVAAEILQVLAVLSLVGSWFQLKNEDIFHLRSKTKSSGSHWLSPAHGALILLIGLILYLFYLNVVVTQEEDDEIESEGLADYWDAVR